MTPEQSAALVDRLMGPHEWGYRDPVEGGFITDNTPFEAAQALTSKAGTDEVVETVAWLHTLHMECGQTMTRLLDHDGKDDDEPKRTAFGIPGRDYSEEYPVTSEPLFASLAACQPMVEEERERIVAWLREHWATGQCSSAPTFAYLAYAIERGDHLPVIEGEG